MLQGQNKIFVIVAPSRGGKDAVVRGLLRQRSLQLLRVVTHTTREKRKSEQEGSDYSFVSKTRFEQMRDDGMFFEWMRYNQAYYGLSKREVEIKLETRKNLIVRMDIRGAKRMKQFYKDRAILIFLKPQRLSDLAKRFGAEFSLAQKQARLKRARQEIAHAGTCDYIVVNYDGKIDETIQKVGLILKIELAR